jgi:hypothetical protein
MSVEKPLGTGVNSVAIQSPPPNGTIGTSFLVHGVFSTAGKRDVYSYSVQCQLMKSGAPSNPDFFYTDYVNYGWLALFLNKVPAGGYSLQAGLYVTGQPTPVAATGVPGLTLSGPIAVSITAPPNGAPLPKTFPAQGNCPGSTTEASCYLFNSTNKSLVQTGTTTFQGASWTSQFANATSGGPDCLIAEAWQNQVSLAAAMVANLTIQQQ